MRLADVQAALKAELDGNPCAELRALITSATLAPGDCLQLYRDLRSHAGVLTLKQLYPVTQRLLGTDLLQLLARQYAARYKTAMPSEQFGMHFAQLLQDCTSRHCEIAVLDFLPELARLEWALHCAWRAADDPALNFNSLDYVPEEEQYRLRMVPSQALQLLRFNWPVLDIWDKCQTQCPSELRLYKRPVWVCVYRQWDKPRAEIVSDKQARLLNGIIGGQTLYQLSRAVPDINQHLTVLIARRWITRFELPPDLATPEDPDNEEPFL